MTERNDMTEGVVVHFVPANMEGARPGHCMAAIVVRSWESAGKWGTVNLAVLPDGSNDRSFELLTERAHGSVSVVWKTSVRYIPAPDEVESQYSYHDPLACPFE